eukprot:Nitzschia sp. Nitz4//scaffold327_size20599//17050//17970//NITZ4_008637-RA/size20599-processed-gene-0.17-mRNA-1//-1//CDS//3329547949//2687//frame0
MTDVENKQAQSCCNKKIETSTISETERCDPSKGECVAVDATRCVRLVYPVPPQTEAAAFPDADLTRKLVAEYLGTALLVMVVIGSGIMAQNLSEDVGVQLTMNSVATIGGLYGLITIFGPVSGAHFNPCVSYVDVLYQSMEVKTFVFYSVAQILGGITGGIVADIQFAEPVIFSTKERFGYELWISEVIGTVTLILVIHGSLRTGNESSIPAVVAMWVGGGYFFTNSTIFANPAVTIGRMFSDTFAGIEPRSAAVYIPFQLLGATIGFMLTKYLYCFENEDDKKTEATKDSFQRVCVVSLQDSIQK